LLLKIMSPIGSCREHRNGLAIRLAAAAGKFE
jgi:hypothetical protein